MYKGSRLRQEGACVLFAWILIFKGLKIRRSSSCLSLETSQVEGRSRESVALLIGEQLRCHTTWAAYERRLDILSDHKLKLAAFIVTDTSISEKVEYRKLSIIRNVHVLSSIERAAETRFITRGVGNETIEWGNMKQWFKTLLAFEDMVAHEKTTGVRFTHACRLRTDIAFRSTFPFDKLNLSLNGVFMNTDMVIFASRKFFPQVLVSNETVNAFFGKFAQYVPISSGVIISSDPVGKFSWICWPNLLFANSSWRPLDISHPIPCNTNHGRNPICWPDTLANFAERARVLDEVNRDVIVKNIAFSTVACQVGGPRIDFSSERIALLNILVQNVSVHAGLDADLVEHRKNTMCTHVNLSNLS